MFKGIVVLVALTLTTFACTASTEPTDESENTGSEAEALGTVLGYCDVSASTGLLSGKCRGGAGMCCQYPAAACPTGAAPLQAVSFGPGQCGSSKYDAQRRCTSYCF